MIRHASALVAIALAGLLAGCEILPPAEDYSRCPEKVVTLAELVTPYNANARRVPKLWARAAIRIESEGIGWGSAAKGASPNALLLLSKEESTANAPNFTLIGRESSVEIFRMGTDARSGLYYLWLMLGDQGRAYYGRQEMSGAPGVRLMPVDPVLLVEVLGVTGLPALRPGAVPTIVPQMQGKPVPAYVLRYVKPQPVTGQWRQWREVQFRWGEKGPGQVFRVKLYDAKGFCRVWADVDDYAPVEVDGEETGPMMPTYIRMHWPAIKGVQSASKLEIRLSKMTTRKVWSKKVFDFAPHLPAGMGLPVQVDEQHGRVSPTGGPR